MPRGVRHASMIQASLMVAPSLPAGPEPGVDNRMLFALAL
jgi:hypothetical protein